MIYQERTNARRYGIFITPPSVPVFHLMRTYNRRFAAMARKRRGRGTFGRQNDCQRFMFGGYTFERDGANTKHLAKALLHWARLELTEGWRSWFSAKSVAIPSLKEAPVGPA